MTAPVQDQTQQNDKELNFRALEAKYQRQSEEQQRQLERERQARLEAEKRLQESHKTNMVDDDDDDESEPYVDHKKLKKSQQKFGQQIKQETQSEIQKAVQVAIEKERQQNWLKSNPDFDEVMKQGDKFYAHDPELAETILSMPEGFERAKLVYKTIKSLGLHENKPKESPIQQRINNNSRNPIQPSTLGVPAYAGQQSDYSKEGQKKAYEKMQELKSRLQL